MQFLDSSGLNSVYRLIDAQILQGHFPAIRDKFEKVRLTYPACEERLRKLLQNQDDTLEVLREKVQSLRVLNHNLNKIGLSK